MVSTRRLCAALLSDQSGNSIGNSVVADKDRCGEVDQIGEVGSRASLNDGPADVRLARIRWWRR